jgi:hypothetical protein
MYYLLECLVLTHSIISLQLKVVDLRLLDSDIKILELNIKRYGPLPKPIIFKTNLNLKRKVLVLEKEDKIWN